MTTFTADTFAARLEDAITGAAHRIGTTRDALEAWLRRWAPRTTRPQPAATRHPRHPPCPLAPHGLEPGWGL